MKRFIAALFILLPSLAFSQAGVSFHQSNLPFVGLNYEFNQKIRPEVRLGVDDFFDYMSLEGVVTYDFVEKDDFEFYAGVGGRVTRFEGIVLPLGLNVYPLNSKQFGFHIEAAPILGEKSLLRGSWGIRYRFNKKQSN